MVDEVLRKLIEFLQQVSPMVWGTLVRQVSLEAITWFLWTVISLSMSVYTAILWKKYNKLYARERKVGDTDRSRDDWDTRRIISSIISLVTGFIGVAAFTIAMRMILNPSYYAIQYIINSITGD